ncbi:hypothetical protein BDZ97DRAFT_1770294 [Flammula alnicola]|nr:hypothetical protein BDZ97DRAFT_1770294 [Flammula alnicola]
MAFQTQPDLSNLREHTVQKVHFGYSKKAPAWAEGSGLSNYQAGPKPAPGQHLWPGLARLLWARLGSASGLRPEPTHHYPPDRIPILIATFMMLAEDEMIEPAKVWGWVLYGVLSSWDHHDLARTWELMCI